MAAVQKERRGIDDDDDDMPRDIDEFRIAMARRICNFLGRWRTCKEPICKRARACRGKTLACSGGAPKLTPQQDARYRARMVHALAKAIANKEIASAEALSGERSGR